MTAKPKKLLKYIKGGGARSGTDVTWSIKWSLVGEVASGEIAVRIGIGVMGIAKLVLCLFL